jgi:hypothetical protein
MENGRHSTKPGARHATRAVDTGREHEKPLGKSPKRAGGPFRKGMHAPR